MGDLVTPLPDLKNIAFQVNFNKIDWLKPSTPCVYSEKLNKLFVDSEKVFGAHFTLNIASEHLPFFQIRTRVAFAQLEYMNSVVEMCAMHNKNDSGSHNHFLCHNFGQGVAKHEEKNGHQTIVMDLKPSPTGSIDAFYSAHCLCTCATLKGKPLNLIFILETKSGQEVARQTVGLKVCRCPGRDILVEEAKASTPKAKRRRVKKQETFHDPCTNVKQCDSDDEEYTLIIEGVPHDVAEQLSNAISEALELYDQHAAKEKSRMNSKKF